MRVRSLYAAVITGVTATHARRRVRRQRRDLRLPPRRRGAHVRRPPPAGGRATRPTRACASRASPAQRSMSSTSPPTAPGARRRLLAQPSAQPGQPAEHGALDLDQPHVHVRRGRRGDPGLCRLHARPAHAGRGVCWRCFPRRTTASTSSNLDTPGTLDLGDEEPIVNNPSWTPITAVSRGPGSADDRRRLPAPDRHRARPSGDADPGRAVRLRQRRPARDRDHAGRRRHRRDPERRRQLPRGLQPGADRHGRRRPGRRLRLATTTTTGFRTPATTASVPTSARPTPTATARATPVTRRRTAPMATVTESPTRATTARWSSTRIRPTPTATARATPVTRRQPDRPAAAPRVAPRAARLQRA